MREASSTRLQGVSAHVRAAANGECQCQCAAQISLQPMAGRSAVGVVSIPCDVQEPEEGTEMEEEEIEELREALESDFELG